MPTRTNSSLPISKSKLGYTTSNVYRMPVKKVWDAATDPKHLKKHFIDGMKGTFNPKLEPVSWNWKDWGDWNFTPIKYQKEKELVFLAPEMGGKYQIKVRFEFLRKNGKTVFRVHEEGYMPKDLKTAFMNCEGWSEFHTGLKTYLKYGGDPRKI